MISSLIEKLSKKVTVCEVPDIKKGFLSKVLSRSPGSKEEWLLKTEGVNLQVYTYSTIVYLAGWLTGISYYYYYRNYGNMRIY